MKWYLDVGHGGRDPGAVGSNGTKESNVVLKIGMLVKDMLCEAFEKVRSEAINKGFKDTYIFS